MSVTCLQANVGRSREAQDLFLQTLAENNCVLGIAAEPNNVPRNHPCWVGDTLASVAITWRWWRGAPICSHLESGERYVAVRMGSVAVVGVYLPPSGTLVDFESWLEALESCIHRLRPLPIIMAGDFNSWSRSWGSKRTGARGRMLEVWAAEQDLVLLNRGNTATCVRTRGESVVDLTWASPPIARRVREWRVMTEAEHLSDHRYILVRLEAQRSVVEADRRPENRWALKKLDSDKLLASITSALWSVDSMDREEEDIDPTKDTEWIVGTMKRACDASMPRIKHQPRRSTYWWSEEIATLRREAIRRGRKVARCKRDEARRTALMIGYREIRKSLKIAIKRAKATAWEELLQTLEEDPRGRPYKMVLNKLRPAAPPLAETLDPEFMEDVVTTLFPTQDRERDGERRDEENSDLPAFPFQDHQWSEEHEIGMKELQWAVQRGLKGTTAPGPDGIPKKAWALAMQVLAERVQRLFNNCLKKGVFPSVWREAQLVLLRKEGKDVKTSSAYRPICLLDEAGKLYERILANRIVRHLKSVGPNLSEAQYGFRENMSTIDAIRHVRTLAEERTAQGGVVLAVSLDIANAFNSLPWHRIKESLRWHQMPGYLARIMDDYLRDRWVIYTDREGRARRARLHRGVPQGSVLGPLLWDLGYNVVLQTALPPGCSITCYADDTIILAGGRTWEEAMTRGEIAVHSTIGSIKKAGLKVAAQKTEALFFYTKKQGPPPPNVTLEVTETRVQIGSQMKYLGLILDNTWNFEKHFVERARCIRERANALRRLLPNLGGANGRVRRLYVNTVRSIALYGAPVWVRELETSRRSRIAMEQAFHVIALRTARAYRTVSRPAAAVLASLVPLELVAREYAEMYEATRSLRQQGVKVSASIKARLREQYRSASVHAWKGMLQAQSTQGQRVLEAIQPVLEYWLNRAWGGTTYRMTQILSGHGCFGAFLCRIGREDSRRCHHCDHPEDTAQHTLKQCPAWAKEREALVEAVGADLSLSAVIPAILASREAWRAFSRFCEQVMTRKEEAERLRRGQVPGNRPRPKTRGRSVVVDRRSRV